eukprot:1198644-Amphidinium_carterae.1
MDDKGTLVYVQSRNATPITRVPKCESHVCSKASWIAAQMALRPSTKPVWKRSRLVTGCHCACSVCFVDMLVLG